MRLVLVILLPVLIVACDTAPAPSSAGEMDELQQKLDEAAVRIEALEEEARRAAATPSVAETVTDTPFVVPDSSAPPTPEVSPTTAPPTATVAPTPASPPAVIPVTPQSTPLPSTPEVPLHPETAKLNACMSLWDEVSIHELTIRMAQLSGLREAAATADSMLIAALQNVGTAGCQGVGRRAGLESGSPANCQAVRQNILTAEIQRSQERFSGIAGLGSNAKLVELRAYEAAACN